MTLFDQNPQAAATEAIERGLESAAPGWQETALQAAYDLCLRMTEFTTDELESVAAKTHDPRAIGGIMRIAAKRGWCAATDRTRESRLASCHGRPKRVWKSLITTEGNHAQDR